jgi:hypothetical protein
MTGSRCAASPPGRILSPKQLCAEASRCRPSPGSHTKIIPVRRMVTMLQTDGEVASCKLKGYSEREGEITHLDFEVVAFLRSAIPLLPPDNCTPEASVS